ncbi:hypothetical protein ACK1CN_12860 [Vibrio coralliilyticus]|uniref:hypothetical protein n=1 Tax=Vibrio coralliilyticus TaxID=190893 RepID=UPI0039174C6A
MKQVVREHPSLLLMKNINLQTDYFDPTLRNRQDKFTLEVIKLAGTSLYSVVDLKSSESKHELSIKESVKPILTIEDVYQILELNRAVLDTFFIEFEKPKSDSISMFIPVEMAPFSNLLSSAKFAIYTKGLGPFNMSGMFLVPNLSHICWSSIEPFTIKLVIEPSADRALAMFKNGEIDLTCPYQFDIDTRSGSSLTVQTPLRMAAHTFGIPHSKRSVIQALNLSARTGTAIYSGECVVSYNPYYPNHLFAKSVCEVFGSRAKLKQIEYMASRDQVCGAFVYPSPVVQGVPFEFEYITYFDEGTREIMWDSYLSYLSNQLETFEWSDSELDRTVYESLVQGQWLTAKVLYRKSLKTAVTSLFTELRAFDLRGLKYD